MTPIAQDSAELVAIQALAWIAGHDELLPVFLGSSGATEDDIRARAREPEFLGSVLDFLLMDDAWVTEFCQSNDIPPDLPIKARASLPGGSEMNWT
jgi:hypothetical protein